ncbi:MAG: DUF1015 domain-containing protein [Candidatus Margulisiibacteriota bacterium]
MAHISPFKGITFNKDKFPDISNLVCPPYDVLFPRDQDRYYLKSENNIVRIILGKDFASDNEKDNKYSRAAGYLRSWLEEGILSEDRVPSMYIYQQQFVHKGKKYSRKGFFGLVRLDEKGEVKFHENTYQKPKEDRMKLLKAALANTEPVFMVYKGYPVSLPETEPAIRFTDDSASSHSLWRVDDSAEIDDFCSEFKDKPVYIADGHHRFETAFKYARELGIDPSSSDPRNFALAYFAEESDPGLLVLPTHRLLKISEEDIELLKNTAKKYFLMVEIDSFEKITKAKGKVFGFSSRKDNKLYMLKLRDTVAKNKVMKAKGRQDQADIETAILHTLLLDDVLEKYKGEDTKDVISYSHDDKEALASVRSGSSSCAFLLNPSTISQIMETADAGARMPQKSTFFYPKVLSGLVMRKFG